MEVLYIRLIHHYGKTLKLDRQPGTRKKSCAFPKHKRRITSSGIEPVAGVTF